MEEEARAILRAGLRAKQAPPLDLAQSIRKYVEPFGGVELVIPARESIRRAPKLTKALKPRPADDVLRWLAAQA